MGVASGFSFTLDTCSGFIWHVVASGGCFAAVMRAVKRHPLGLNKLSINHRYLRIPRTDQLREFEQ